jgi:hypothetical protein
MKPANHGRLGPVVEVAQGGQLIESLDPTHPLDNHQSLDGNLARGDFTTTPGQSPEPLLGLVDLGWIEPEDRMLGPEPSWTFGNPTFAEDQRLSTRPQRIADSGPFLEGDRAGFGQGGV